MSNLSESYAFDREAAEAAAFKHGGVDMICTVCRDIMVRPHTDDGTPHEPAERGYNDSCKRIAIAHEPGDMVVIWSERNAHLGELSDYLRMSRARLIELLRGWLRPEEIIP